MSSSDVQRNSKIEVFRLSLSAKGHPLEVCLFLLAVAVAITALRVGLDKLKLFLKHHSFHAYHKILKMLIEDIMILGIVHFAIAMSQVPVSSGLDDASFVEMSLIFEFAVMFMFFLACFMLFSACLLIGVSEIHSWMWKSKFKRTMDELIEKKEVVKGKIRDANWVFKALYWLRKLSLKDTMLLLELKKDFIQEHGLPPDYDFAGYLASAFMENVLQFLYLPIPVWILLICTFALNVATIDVDPGEALVNPNAQLRSYIIILGWLPTVANFLVLAMMQLKYNEFVADMKARTELKLEDDDNDEEGGPIDLPPLKMTQYFYYNSIEWTYFVIKGLFIVQSYYATTMLIGGIYYIAVFFSGKTAWMVEIVALLPPIAYIFVLAPRVIPIYTILTHCGDRANLSIFPCLDDDGHCHSDNDGSVTPSSISSPLDFNGVRNALERHMQDPAAGITSNYNRKSASGRASPHSGNVSPGFPKAKNKIESEMKVPALWDGLDIDRNSSSNNRSSSNNNNSNSNNNNNNNPKGKAPTTASASSDKKFPLPSGSKTPGSEKPPLWTGTHVVKPKLQIPDPPASDIVIKSQLEDSATAAAAVSATSWKSPSNNNNNTPSQQQQQQQPSSSSTSSTRQPPPITVPENKTRDDNRDDNDNDEEYNDMYGQRSPPQLLRAEAILRPDSPPRMHHMSAFDPKAKKTALSHDFLSDLIPISGIKNNNNNNNNNEDRASSPPLSRGATAATVASIPKRSKSPSSFSAAVDEVAIPGPIAAKLRGRRRGSGHNSGSESSGLSSGDESGGESDNNSNMRTSSLGPIRENMTIFEQERAQHEPQYAAFKTGDGDDGWVWGNNGSVYTSSSNVDIGHYHHQQADNASYCYYPGDGASSVGGPPPSFSSQYGTDDDAQSFQQFPLHPQTFVSYQQPFSTISSTPDLVDEYYRYYMSLPAIQHQAPPAAAAAPSRQRYTTLEDINLERQQRQYMQQQLEQQQLQQQYMQQQLQQQQFHQQQQQQQQHPMRRSFQTMDNQTSSYSTGDDTTTIEATTTTTSSSKDNTWVEAYDTKHKRHYYYNKVTKKSVWKLPPGGVVVVPGVQEGEDENGENDDESDGDGDDTLPKGWTKEYDTKHQKVYYFHAESNTSVWRKPKKEIPRTKQDCQVQVSSTDLLAHQLDVSMSLYKKPLEWRKLNPRVANNTTLPTRANRAGVVPPSEIQRRRAKGLSLATVGPQRSSQVKSSRPKRVLNVADRHQEEEEEQVHDVERHREASAAASALLGSMYKSKSEIRDGKKAVTTTAGLNGNGPTSDVDEVAELVKMIWKDGLMGKGNEESLEYQKQTLSMALAAAALLPPLPLDLQSWAATQFNGNKSKKESSIIPPPVVQQQQQQQEEEEEEGDAPFGKAEATFSPLKVISTTATVNITESAPSTPRAVDEEEQQQRDATFPLPVEASQVLKQPVLQKQPTFPQPQSEISQQQQQPAQLQRRQSFPEPIATLPPPVPTNTPAKQVCWSKVTNPTVKEISGLGILRSFEGRLRTFYTMWPHSRDHRPKCTPEILASLGFRYGDTGDAAKCVYCGLCLNNWKKENDPRKEHLRLSPNCPFILGRIVEAPSRIAPAVTETIIKRPTSAQGSTEGSSSRNSSRQGIRSRRKTTPSTTERTTSSSSRGSSRRNRNAAKPIFLTTTSDPHFRPKTPTQSGVGRQPQQQEEEEYYDDDEEEEYYDDDEEEEEEYYEEEEEEEEYEEEEEEYEEEEYEEEQDDEEVMDYDDENEYEEEEEEEGDGPYYDDQGEAYDEEPTYDEEEYEDEQDEQEEQPRRRAYID